MLHLEEMLVAPLAHATIVVGFVVGGIVRGLLVAALVTVVALFFTELEVAHPLIMLSTILLTAVVFSLAGLFNAIFAKTFDDISIIPTFVLTPLTYLGGVFFSISLLPPVWQKVALVNPILYMVNAFRYGMLGRSDIPIGVAYTIMLGLCAVFFAAVLIMLRRGTGTRA
jgi:ABC-2 type transport system permease protein